VPASRQLAIAVLAALVVCAPPAHATLVDIGAGLTGVQGGCGAWGDYDNDGDLDLAIVGYSVAGPFGRVYRNDAGTFTPTRVLPAMYGGQVAWGDYDRDGDLDLGIVGTLQDLTNIARVLRNQGDTLVTAVTLEGLQDAALAWGDYDNDGDLDLATAGYNGTAPVTHVYRNDGGGVFTDAVPGLVGARRAALAWCDEDRDGDLDLVVAGSTASWPPSTTLYANNGAGGFVASSPFPGVAGATLRWADWDLDGDPDLLVDGTGDNYIGKVYRNTAGTFADAGQNLEAMDGCNAAWGDWDGDGDPDLALGGTTGSIGLSLVYQNNAGALANASAGLPGLYDASVAWGDYDNDGRLDLFLAGLPNSGSPLSRIYHNTGTAPNTPPSAPSNLSVSVAPTTVTFQWSAATDTQTPAAALSYHLWVGHTPAAADIVPAMADLATGRGRLPLPGNVGQRLSWTMPRAVLPSHVAWGVQAIDASYAGSAFATHTSEPVAAPSSPPPAGVALRLAGPNPFAGGVRLACALDRTRAVRVAVADVGGRVVRTLADAAWPAGTHELRWDGDDAHGAAAAAGVYFVRLDAGDASRTLRVLKLR